jgi:hypothetical protein
VFVVFGGIVFGLRTVSEGGFVFGGNSDDLVEASVFQTAGDLIFRPVLNDVLPEAALGFDFVTG